MTNTEKILENNAELRELIEAAETLPDAGGASVQADWTVNDESDPAYVKGRTHWHETRVNAIRWNGLPEDRESVDVGPVYGYPTGFLIAYKISDEVLSKDKIASAEVKLSNEGGSCTTQFAEPEDLYPSAIWTASYQGDASTQAGGTIICTTLAGDFSSTFGVVIPSKGTYALQTSGAPHTISIENGSEEIWHTLDKKFLPSDLATGGAIVDVGELPTEDINEDVLYRKLIPTFVYNRQYRAAWPCYPVEDLPTTGSPAIQGSLSDISTLVVTGYYLITDGVVYGYINAPLSAVFGVPSGWYPASVLFNAVGWKFDGVIRDIEDDPSDDTNRVLLRYVLYSVKDFKWTALDAIGWRGTGAQGEVFNKYNNEASGNYSHAEGYNTTASGYSSHAEGDSTTASGDYSHAEGYNTTASDSFSHAEGYNITASGYSSHAEGYNTTASGYHSHAEGYGTVASGYDQHVQGCCNIEDTENKYAHIVGNGGGHYNRSNAHTLDWDGNAWYAGYVEGTALILPSPNGTRWRITVDDSGNLVTAVET